MAIHVIYQFCSISRKKSVEKGRKVGRFLATDRKVGRSFFDDRPQTLVGLSIYSLNFNIFAEIDQRKVQTVCKIIKEAHGSR